MSFLNKYTIIACIFSCFTCSSMENQIRNDFIPKDIIVHIMSIPTHESPWKNFMFFVRLARVCQTWHSIFSKERQELYAKQLQIPPMHLAAMKNEANSIIDLKLKYHCTSMPDIRGFTPAHYAVACRQHDALKMLKIGGCLDYSMNEEYIKNLEEYRHKSDKISARIMRHKRSKTDLLAERKYTIKDLCKAIKKNNVHKIKSILYQNYKLAMNDIQVVKENITKKTNQRISSLIKYNICSILEKCIFTWSFRERNLTEKFLQCCAKMRINFNAYNTNGFTILQCICAKDLLSSTLTLLLKHGYIKPTDIDRPSMPTSLNALQIAAGSGASVCLKKLLDTKITHNIPFNTSDEMAILYATQTNYIKCIQNLLEADIKPTAKNNLGMTPLHYTARNASSTCMTELLKTGHYTSVDLVDIHNRTPLCFAVCSGNLLCITLLLEKGANPNIVTKADHIEEKRLYGATVQRAFCGLFSPLHYAVQKNNYEAIKLLLRYGADKNLQSQSKKTPYMMAVESGCSPRIIKSLNPNRSKKKKKLPPLPDTLH